MRLAVLAILALAIAMPLLQAVAAQLPVIFEIVAPDKIAVQRDTVFRLPISYTIEGDANVLSMTLKVKVLVDSFELVGVSHGCKKLEVSQELGYKVVTCKYIEKNPSRDTIVVLVLKAKRTDHIMVEWVAEAITEDKSYGFIGSKTIYVVVEKPFTIRIAPAGIMAGLVAIGASQLLPQHYKHLLLLLGIALLLTGIIALGLISL